MYAQIRTFHRVDIDNCKQVKININIGYLYIESIITLGATIREPTVLRGLPTRRHYLSRCFLPINRCGNYTAADYFLPSAMPYAVSHMHARARTPADSAQRTHACTQRCSRFYSTAHPMNYTPLVGIACKSISRKFSVFFRK